jgi:hypothetical protein
MSFTAGYSPTLAEFAADVAAGSYRSGPLVIYQLPA